jgi:GAF domain-containing protein
MSGAPRPAASSPGRRPAWIPDVVRDPNFPRAPVAAREGLHGAFGFPILIKDETLGIMEFFSREIREPDEDLLRMLETVGRMIGQVIDTVEDTVRGLAPSRSSTRRCSRRSRACVERGRPT